MKLIESPELDLLIFARLTALSRFANLALGNKNLAIFLAIPSNRPIWSRLLVLVEFPTFLIKARRTHPL
jgi:hypothetical protein